MKLEIHTVTNKKEYRAALAELSALMSRHPHLTREESARLDILGLLVDAYEKKHFPLEKPSPIEMLEFVMENRGMTRADLVPFIGSKSKVSEVLAGKRSFSLAMIRKLHRGLSIPADILLAEPAVSG
jgi:HTH-type transcriptional regulator/antitoxin HigA